MACTRLLGQWCTPRREVPARTLSYAREPLTCDTWPLAQQGSYWRNVCFTLPSILECRISRSSFFRFLRALNTKIHVPAFFARSLSLALALWLALALSLPLARSLSLSVSLSLCVSVQSMTKQQCSVRLPAPSATGARARMAPLVPAGARERAPTNGQPDPRPPTAAASPPRIVRDATGCATRAPRASLQSRRGSDRAPRRWCAARRAGGGCTARQSRRRRPP